MNATQALARMHGTVDPLLRNSLTTIAGFEQRNAGRSDAEMLAELLSHGVSAKDATWQMQHNADLTIGELLAQLQYARMATTAAASNGTASPASVASLAAAAVPAKTAPAARAPTPPANDSRDIAAETYTRIHTESARRRGEAVIDPAASGTDSQAICARIRAEREALQARHQPARPARMGAINLSTMHDAGSPAAIKPAVAINAQAIYAARAAACQRARR